MQTFPDGINFLTDKSVESAFVTLCIDPELARARLKMQTSLSGRETGARRRFP